MTPPIISIIIPVFNVEKYISRCLDSIFEQDIDEDNYEVIIINDGTLDNSMTIANKYASAHQNIVIINKENGGVSSARNIGIERSNGKYIIFVDPDDAIEENILGRIIIEVEKYPVEFLLLNLHVSHVHLKKIEIDKFPRNLSGKVFSGSETFNLGYFRGSVCGVIFKRHFLLKFNLRFNEELKNSEDTLFIAICFIHASSLRHTDLNFYKIYYRPESASRLWSYKKIKELLDIFNVINKYLENNSLSPTQKAILYHQGYIAICYILSNLFALNRFDKYIEIKRHILKSGLYPININDIKFGKYKIQILNLSFDLFSCLYLFKRIVLNLQNQIKKSSGNVQYNY